MPSLEQVFGATGSRVVEITIWIPSADRDGRALGEQQQDWKEKAIHLFAELFKAATALPPADGAWRNPRTNKVIRERSILVYTYVSEEEAQDMTKLQSLGEFCRRMDKAMFQGEVAIKIGDRLFLVPTW